VARVVAGLTISLDGYAEQPGGGSGRLYADLHALRASTYMRDLIAATGAVVMGRRAFDMAKDPDWYAGNYEFQTPIFVVTSHPPARHPRETGNLRFTFVTAGVRPAVEQAREAAGGRDVQVIGGVLTVQSVLREGLADELHVEVVPLVLGGGRRLLEGAEFEHLTLEKLEARDFATRTQLRFGVRIAAAQPR